MIELQKLLILDELIIELLEVFGLARVLGLDELYESPLELARSLFYVFEGVAGEVPDSHLMTFRVEVALESVLILTLFPAELAKVFQSA